MQIPKPMQYMIHTCFITNISRLKEAGETLSDLSYNVFLKTSFTHLSHNGFLTASFSQRRYHIVALT